MCQGLMSQEKNVFWGESEMEKCGAVSVVGKHTINGNCKYY